MPRTTPPSPAIETSVATRGKPIENIVLGDHVVGKNEVDPYKELPNSLDFYSSVWHTAERDTVLPSGLRFEVTDGIITYVQAQAGEPELGLVGSRYAPGDLEATDVTYALWRNLDLSLTKADGSVALISISRPLWWLEETQAQTGGSIDLSMIEVGIEGSALITRIGACDSRLKSPVEQSGLVIGTIAHQNAIVWDLAFNGDTARPLGVTANHPLFSFDRNDWVAAGEIRIDERVLTTSGTATLTGKNQRPDRHTVYNMEVHRCHSYHVSQFGILAHNTGIACPILTAGQKAEVRLLAAEGYNIRTAIRHVRGDAVKTFDVLPYKVGGAFPFCVMVVGVFSGFISRFRRRVRLSRSWVGDPSPSHGDHRDGLGRAWLLAAHPSGR